MPSRTRNSQGAAAKRDREPSSAKSKSASRENNDMILLLEQRIVQLEKEKAQEQPIKISKMEAQAAPPKAEKHKITLKGTSSYFSKMASTFATKAESEKVELRNAWNTQDPFVKSAKFASMITMYTSVPIEHARSSGSLYVDESFESAWTEVSRIIVEANTNNEITLFRSLPAPPVKFSTPQPEETSSPTDVQQDHSLNRQDQEVLLVLPTPEERSPDPEEPNSAVGCVIAADAAKQNIIQPEETAAPKQETAAHKQTMLQHNATKKDASHPNPTAPAQETKKVVTNLDSAVAVAAAAAKRTIFQPKEAKKQQTNPDSTNPAEEGRTELTHKPTEATPSIIVEYDTTATKGVTNLNRRIPVAVGRAMGESAATATSQLLTWDMELQPLMWYHYRCTTLIDDIKQLCLERDYLHKAVGNAARLIAYQKPGVEPILYLQARADMSYTLAPSKLEMVWYNNLSAPSSQKVESWPEFDEAEITSTPLFLNYDLTDNIKHPHRIMKDGSLCLIQTVATKQTTLSTSWDDLKRSLAGSCKPTKIICKKGTDLQSRMKAFSKVAASTNKPFYITAFAMYV